MVGRYKPYSEYKDSGVEWLGDVPGHWGSVPIKYMALESESLFLDGDWIESKDISGEGIRYITTGNVTNGKYREQGTGYITEDTFLKLNCTEVLEGDVLIARLNDPIGRACIVPNLESKIVTSVDNVIFRPDKKYHKNYLVHLFSSEGYFRHTGNLARGATMQRISRGLLGNIRIVTPLFEEQEKIANFLDHETAKIDTLIEKQQQLIQLLKEKRQAVISHAVTKGISSLNGGPNAKMRDSGVEWLGDMPEHWDDVSRIKYVSSLKGRQGWQGLKAEEYLDEGPFVVSSAHFYNHKIQWDDCPHVSLERYERDSNIQLGVGDLLLMKDGAAMGKLAYVDELPDKACLNSHVLLLRPINKDESVAYDPRFMYYFMQAEFFQEHIKIHGTGVTFLGISQQSIGNYQLILPPLSEQREIVQYLEAKIEKLDALANKQQNMMSLLQERRTALISAAVTGKIDVRDLVAPPASPTHKEVAA